MNYFRLWHGSVQSKAISLIAVASIILTPLTPAYAAFGDGSPTVPNPTVFTGQVDAPNVDGATGAFTQQIPIDIPPGRNGLRPDVSLDYSSQRTQDSIVGYGWSLSIPYIQRLNKTGSQDLYTSNAYFTSSVDGELVGSTAPPSSFPTILTTPLTFHSVANSTSDSFSYTVPPGGTNKLLIVEVGANVPTPPSSMTQNGVALTVASFATDLSGQFFGHSYGYLAAPTSGTFTITWPSAQYFDYVVFTVQDAAQTNPIDANYQTGIVSATTFSTAATTSVGNDLLLSMPDYYNTAAFSHLDPAKLHTSLNITTRTSVRRSLDRGNQPRLMREVNQ